MNSAKTLTTARTVQTNLGITTAASFNGSANIAPGVSGMLPVANGGTGTNSAPGIRSMLFGTSGTPPYLVGINSGFASGFHVAPASLTVGSATWAENAGYSSNAGYAGSCGSAEVASRLTQWPAIGPNAKISADAGGFYFMATGPYHMVNYWNTGYNSVQAWTFTAVSTEEAKTDIRQTGEDLGRGLLGAVPVLYKQKPPAAKKGRSAGLTEGKESVPPPEQLGFTAEQLSEVFPEAVVYEEEKPAGINLYALITGVVALCQTQQAELDALRERVAVLEGLLAASDRE